MSSATGRGVGLSRAEILPLTECSNDHVLWEAKNLLMTICLTLESLLNPPKPQFPPVTVRHWAKRFHLGSSEPLPFMPCLLAVCSTAGNTWLSSGGSAPKRVIYEAVTHLGSIHQVGQAGLWCRQPRRCRKALSNEMGRVDGGLPSVREVLIQANVWSITWISQRLLQIETLRYGECFLHDEGWLFGCRFAAMRSDVWSPSLTPKWCIMETMMLFHHDR